MNMTFTTTRRLEDDNPHIIRPIPRRPLNFNIEAVTPPSDADDESDGYVPNPNRHLSSAQLFGGLQPAFPNASTAISRQPSAMNLTSSTLAGIFDPATSANDKLFGGEPAVTDTPWGVGAQTPIKRPTVDDATYELMKTRSHLHRRRSSYGGRDYDGIPQAQQQQQPPTTSSPSLVLRGLLLVVLGLGYGALVTQFHKEQQLVSLPEKLSGQSYNWMHIAFWGLGGALIGGVLPWLDGVFEEAADNSAVVEEEVTEATSDDSSSIAADWSPEMRAVGAFVGIVFAIRKLPWASTLQASGTLALVNPLLWWLIDRSLAGFVLSASFSLAGTLLLLGVNPEMMPAPSSMMMTVTNSLNESAPFDTSSAPSPLSQENMVTGVWMLSVLFCSCVCFGNIGRRLSWTSQTGSKGRLNTLR